MASPRPVLQRNGSAAARLARDLEELNRICIALSEIREVDPLLALILQKAREVTGADAGSLYLVEEPISKEISHAPANQGPQAGPRHLRLKFMQNDSVAFSRGEHTLPLTEDSIAGYCAMHGEVIELADAHQIPPDAPYRFQAAFEERSGYCTSSLLTLPMKNAKGEVLGVLQLINCKRKPEAKLVTAEDVRLNVQPFPPRAVQLGLSLASQAAVAYENCNLYQDAVSLFDGFVNASVKAIEQRDPTTSGHSQRVCDMTLAFAEVVNRQATGPYASLHFSRQQMKELRYAALLHDFGKVGVPEEVLVKAKKLYPLQFSRVMDRFDYIRKEAEVRLLRQTLDAILTLPQNQAEVRVREIDEEGAALFDQLDRYVEFIRRANEPTVLPAGESSTLREISERAYADPRGVEHPFLTAEEVRLLAIPRGSLDEDERRQVEAHVVHSFNFLMQIPWTREYSRIPEIARAHHEKLNGKGYPYGLMGNEIPMQTKIMTICDIFDALSASDRPYKQAMPASRALEILQLCARDQEIDAELFRLFVDARIYRSKSP